MTGNTRLHVFRVAWPSCRPVCACDVMLSKALTQHNVQTRRSWAEAGSMSLEQFKDMFSSGTLTHPSGIFMSIPRNQTKLYRSYTITVNYFLGEISLEDPISTVSYHTTSIVMYFYGINAWYSVQRTIPKSVLITFVFQWHAVECLIPSTVGTFRLPDS